VAYLPTVSVGTGSSAPLRRSLWRRFRPHRPLGENIRLVVCDNYVTIVARHSGKALDVEDASTDDGARVIQYTPHGGANQQWLLRQWIKAVT
jgi:hypothetical protein